MYAGKKILDSTVCQTLFGDTANSNFFSFSSAVQVADKKQLFKYCWLSVLVTIRDFYRLFLVRLILQFYYIINQFQFPLINPV